jgi:predicted porin
LKKSMNREKWSIVGALMLLLLSSVAQAQPGPFIGLYVGGEFHDVSHDIRQGDVALLLDPSDDGEVLALNLGYEFSNQVFVSLDFSNADADDTEVTNIVASANYRFPLGSGGASFYLGVIGGYSELEWQEPPVLTLEAKPESEQWFAGVQAGLDYRFSKNWSTTLKYQYHGTEHGTNITTSTGSSKLTHDNYQYLLLGVRYHL